MVNYGSMTGIERLLMAGIVIFSNAFGIPSVVSLFKRRGLQFEAIITLMAVFTSTMYHLCEVLSYDIFLEELKWHRLDNIFVITGISIWTIHITGGGHSRKAIYFSLIISILTQQKDPWNLTYTIIPIAIFDLIAILIFLSNRQNITITYNYQNLLTSLIVLAVGGYFFVKGLDQFDDYLRFNHGIWHLMAAISNYYGMRAASYREIGAEREEKGGYQRVQVGVE